MPLDLPDAGSLGGRGLFAVSRAGGVQVEQGGHGQRRAGGGLVRQRSPPAFTVRDMSSASVRACAGVSAPTLPMVARRERPSGVRYWKTNDFATGGQHQQPEAGQSAVPGNTGLEPGRAASTIRFEIRAMNSRPRLCRVSTM